MTEVKFIYTGYLNIEGTDNSMDTIGEAIEIVRAEYGSQVADYAEFTIEGDDGTSFKGVEIMCGDHIQPVTECRCLL
jgi:hypothetical protein